MSDIILISSEVALGLKLHPIDSACVIKPRSLEERLGPERRSYTTNTTVRALTACLQHDHSRIYKAYRALVSQILNN
jgi:hypothetical protein